VALKTYSLDREAQRLVLHRDKDVLNESYKMRTTVAYGLERFWGEHLRHGLDTEEGKYWKEVWDTLADKLLKPANINLPNDTINLIPAPEHESKPDKKKREQENTKQIEAMANNLWKFAEQQPENQRIALAVLTQLCDCIVWWTQRYK
jgi:hypothetical protein